MDKMPITKDGYDRLTQDIKQLKSVERPRIIKAIAEARAHGDLSENAEYHAAKEQQGLTEARINELDDISARAEVIDPSKVASEKVQFGAHVTLRDEDTAKTQTWQIVSHYEADAKIGQLSARSPIARALIGRKKNDPVEVQTPGGDKAYTILKLEYK